MEKKQNHRTVYCFFLLLAASASHAVTIKNGETKELDDKSATLNLGNLSVLNGSVIIKNGTLETQGATITEKAGETGYVTLSGRDSRWNNTGMLRLGIIDRPLDFDHIVSHASLKITDGANVITDDFVMGNYNEARIDESGFYELTVSGKGSKLKVNNNILASTYNSNRLPNGTVTINIDDGGVIEAENMSVHEMNRISRDTSVNTTLNIKNNGVLNVHKDFYFAKYTQTGHADTPSELNVLSGGKIRAENFYAGIHDAGKHNYENHTFPVSVLISGKGSSVEVTDNFVTGGNPRSFLKVADGAEISAANIIMASGGTSYIIDDGKKAAPEVLVTGAQSKITAQNTMVLGDEVDNVITVEQGGALSARNIIIGNKSAVTTNTGSYVNLLAGGEIITDGISLNKDSYFDNAVIFYGNGGNAGTLKTDYIAGFTGNNKYIPDTGNANLKSGLVFNYQDSNNFSPDLINTINIIKENTNTITLTGNNSRHSGMVVIDDGTLKAGNLNSFGNGVNVHNRGNFDLNGFDQTISSLDNRGVVRLSKNNQTQTTLNIINNLNSDNGTIIFNTELGGDNSVTDKLIINKNSTGNTTVQVNNINGRGEKTEKGIELITVSGDSSGEFKQSGRIVSGAYEYTLQRGGYIAGTDNKNWYLTNLYVEPPVTPVPSDPSVPPEPSVIPVPSEPSLPVIDPATGSYAANTLAANNLFDLRLHDRLGETRYTDALTGETNATSLWLRQVGGHNRFRQLQGQLTTQDNRYVAQIGGDLAQWSTDGLNRYHAGVMAGFADQSSKTKNHINNYYSKGKTTGYSAGLYGTWYADDADKSGLYTDVWVLYNWFDHEVHSEQFSAEKYTSRGVTASVESGYTFKAGEFITASDTVNTFFLQPKAQITFQGVKAKNHKNAGDSDIRSSGDNNIRTRLGLRAYLHGHNVIDDGKGRNFEPFAEINWIYNSQKYGVRINDDQFDIAGTRNIGEIKAGVEGQINTNLNLWGNVAQQIGDAGYSDAQAMLGVKYLF